MSVCVVVMLELDTFAVERAFLRMSSVVVCCGPNCWWFGQFDFNLHGL